MTIALHFIIHDIWFNPEKLCVSYTQDFTLITTVLSSRIRYLVSESLNRDAAKISV